MEQLTLRRMYLFGVITALLLIGAFATFAQIDDTNLIANGDFSNGLSDWNTLSANYVYDEVAESVTLISGELIQNSIVVPADGIYQFSFDCTTTSGQTGSLLYILNETYSDAGTYLQTADCNNGVTLSQRLSLPASAPPTVEYDLLVIGENLILDNFSLVGVSDAVDIDTGLIKNGDFIGTIHWEIPLSSEDTIFNSLEGGAEVGAFNQEARQTNIEVQNDGVYSLSLRCSEPDPNNPNKAVFFVSMDDENQNEPSYSFPLVCNEDVETFSMFLTAGLYEVVILTTGWIDDISLFPVTTEPPENNLIENGDFSFGLSGWTATGDYYFDNELGELTLQSADLVLENIRIPADGLYEFSLDCSSVPGQTGMIFYDIQDNYSGAGTEAQYVSCGEVQTFTHKALLPASTGNPVDGIQYRLEIFGENVIVDNFSLKSLDDLVNIDTGLIHNGDFIGLHGWEINSNSPFSTPYYWSLEGGSEIGAIRDDASISNSVKQTNINVTNEGMYVFSLHCSEFEFSNRNGNSTHVLLGSMAFSEYGRLAVGFGPSCQNEREQFKAYLLPDLYQLDLRIDKSWIDDVSLFPTQEVNDIDTGLIVNGDFLGLNGWTFVDSGDKLNDSYFDFGNDPYYFASEPGSIFLDANATVAATGDIQIDTPGDFRLSLYCHGPIVIEFEHRHDPDLTHSEALDCVISQVDRNISLAAGSYGFKITSASSDSWDVFIDDVSLFLETPEPESVVYNYGEVSVKQKNSNQWHSVAFDEPFEVPPIVVMGPISKHGNQASTLRIRNVTSSGFEYQVDEWDYLDGAHTTITAYYLAMTPGLHDLNGITAFAGQTESDHRFVNVTIDHDFGSAPVIIPQVTSVNEGAAVAPRLMNITSTQFDLKLQEEEGSADRRHASETVDFIAFSSGSGQLGSQTILVGQTDNAVKQDWFAVELDSTINNPVLLASMQTRDGGDPSALRYQNLDSSRFEIKVQEEQSKDEEIKHTTEVVGWIMISR